MTQARRSGVKRFFFVFVAAVVLTGIAAPRASADGKLQWVEVDVSLRPDLRASVTYNVCWRSRGNLHGFYFEGVEENPVFDTATAKAWYDSNSKSLPLSIEKMSGKKWDIILADGKAIHSGDVIYQFTYAADLGRNGNSLVHAIASIIWDINIPTARAFGVISVGIGILFISLGIWFF